MHTTEKTLTGYPSIDKPWLKYYSEEAISAPLPECTVYEYMYNNNKAYLNDIAISYLGKKITYGKLFQLIDRCADAFISLGVQKGEIVTVALPSIPEAVYVVYALNKIGAVANMIHPLAGKNEIRNYLNEVQSSLFIAFDKTLEIIGDEIDNTAVKKTIVVTPAESLSVLKKSLYRFANKQSINKDQVISWPNFLKTGVNVACDTSCRKNPDEVAIISHTGGTTGEPKGVCVSDKNVNAVLHQIGMTLPHDRQERTLVVLPPFINYSLVNGILEALGFGFEAILIPDYKVDKIGEYIKLYKPNHINSIPTYIEAMLSSADIEEGDLSCISNLVSGGEGLDTEKEEVINTFLLKNGAQRKLAKGYGCTELVSSATFTYESCNECGSVGIPLPNMNIKIVDVDTTEEISYMQEGEICLSGPTMMLGYYKNQKATDDLIRKHTDGTSWMHMGDLGYVTEDGLLYITGRIKRIVVTKGKDGNPTKLFPERIEKVIEKVDEVIECCVICVEDIERVNVAQAYVVKDENISSRYLEGQILSICRNELPDYMIPTAIIFIDKLPRTERGKVDYRALEKEAQKL